MFIEMQAVRSVPLLSYAECVHLVTLVAVPDPTAGVCVQGRVGAPHSQTAPVKVTSAIHALCVCLCSLLHLSLLSLSSSHALLGPLISHLS